LGSVGYARSGVDVAVLAMDGSPAGVDQIGEIVCRGDVVMAGYWKNPDATASTLRDGWLHTGDMGSFDACGFLTLRDRSKDVVISGGSNIYPREVEEVLIGHPGVSEACVVGAPDQEWGEVVNGHRQVETGDGGVEHRHTAMLRTVPREQTQGARSEGRVMPTSGRQCRR